MLTRRTQKATTLPKASQPLQKCTQNPEKTSQPLQKCTKNPEKTSQPLQKCTKNPKKASQPLQKCTKNPEEISQPLQKCTKNPKKASQPCQKCTKNPKKASQPCQKCTKNPKKASQPCQKCTKNPEKASQLLKVCFKRPDEAVYPMLHPFRLYGDNPELKQAKAFCYNCKKEVNGSKILAHLFFGKLSCAKCAFYFIFCCDDFKQGYPGAEKCSQGGQHCLTRWVEPVSGKSMSDFLAESAQREISISRFFMNGQSSRSLYILEPNRVNQAVNTYIKALEPLKEFQPWSFAFDILNVSANASPAKTQPTLVSASTAPANMTEPTQASANTVPASIQPTLASASTAPANMTEPTQASANTAPASTQPTLASASTAPANMTEPTQASANTVPASTQPTLASASTAPANMTGLTQTSANTAPANTQPTQASVSTTPSNTQLTKASANTAPTNTQHTQASVSIQHTQARASISFIANTGSHGGIRSFPSSLPEGMSITHTVAGTPSTLTSHNNSHKRPPPPPEAGGVVKALRSIRQNSQGPPSEAKLQNAIHTQQNRNSAAQQQNRTSSSVLPAPKTYAQTDTQVQKTQPSTPTANSTHSQQNDSTKTAHSPHMQGSRTTQSPHMQESRKTAQPPHMQGNRAAPQAAQPWKSSSHTLQKSGKEEGSKQSETNTIPPSKEVKGKQQDGTLLSTPHNTDSCKPFTKQAHKSPAKVDGKPHVPHPPAALATPSHVQQGEGNRLTSQKKEAVKAVTNTAERSPIKGGRTEGPSHCMTVERTAEHVMPQKQVLPETSVMHLSLLSPRKCEQMTSKGRVINTKSPQSVCSLSSKPCDRSSRLAQASQDPKKDTDSSLKKKCSMPFTTQDGKKPTAKRKESHEVKNMDTYFIPSNVLASGNYLVLYPDDECPKECPMCYHPYESKMCRVDLSTLVTKLVCQCNLTVYLVPKVLYENSHRQQSWLIETAPRRVVIQ